MNLTLGIFLLCLATALFSCSKAEQHQSLKPGTGEETVDACTLLPSKEVESVQGEPVTKTSASSKTADGFVISQCYFALPTLSNSINLSLTRKGDRVSARDPVEFWRKTFHRERDADPAKEDKEQERSGEKEEISIHPLSVSGVGDEAYWMGNGVNGALYVLTGDGYLRVGIGGKGDETTKVARAKRLAQMAVEHLKR